VTAARICRVRCRQSSSGSAPLTPKLQSISRQRDDSGTCDESDFQHPRIGHRLPPRTEEKERDGEVAKRQPRILRMRRPQTPAHRGDPERQPTLRSGSGVDWDAEELRE